MTTTHPALLEQASGSMSRSIAGMGHITRDGDDRGAHLLRLVLDLQLDALLLGLGAAAVEATRMTSAVPSPVEPSATVPPWPRWAIEDIDLARTLAAETVHSGAALPATLGPEPGAQEEQIVLRRLIARYESMRDLLGDLLTRTARPQPGGQPAGQTHLHELMAHCQNRLVELRDLTRPELGRRKASYPSEHEFLPGELLG
jgi:hypothetical protein